MLLVGPDTFMNTLELDRKELAGLCRAAGKRPDWAQADGGNASIKHEGLLLTKASGRRLDEVSASKGMVAVDLAALRAVLDDPAYTALPGSAQPKGAGTAVAGALRPLAGVDGAGLLPPPDCELHALGERVCLHVPLVEASAALCLAEAQQDLDEVFHGLHLDHVWAQYRPPGHGLACLVRDALRHRAAPVAALGNHGLVVWAEQVAQALALVERIQKGFAAHFRAVDPPHLAANPAGREQAVAAAVKAARSAWPQLKTMAAAKDPWVQSLAVAGVWAWQPICPDDFVHCGLDVPLLDAASAARPEDLKRRLGADPQVAVMALRDCGVLIAARDERAWRGAAELLQANARARALARTRGHVQALTKEQGLELLSTQDPQGSP